MLFRNVKDEIEMIRVKEGSKSRFIFVDPNEEVELSEALGEKYHLLPVKKQEVPANETDADIKNVLDKKKDAKGKFSKTDLVDMTKKEQVSILKDLGVDDKEVKNLRNEDNRVNKILDLQNAEDN